MYLIPILLPIISIFFVSFTFSKYNLNLGLSFIFCSLIISLICCFFMVYEVIYLNSTCFLTFMPWFKIGNVVVNWASILIN